MKSQKIPLEILKEWLRKRIAPGNLAWLEERAGLLTDGAPENLIFISFSSALRFTGTEPLDLNSEELTEAHLVLPGWNPKDWTCDQAGRIFLLLSLPTDLKSAKVIHQIYQTADVGEATALQKSLAVLANPENHIAWARDGIRSNIQAVFEAITLRNPYPSRYFDDTGWNQMIAKTFFVGAPLHEVVGLDNRNNPALAHMLVDLVYERRAAGREFSPELWRCVGRYADTRALEALDKTIQIGSLVEKKAAALALQACPEKAAAKILEKYPQLSADIANGKLTWENLYHDL
jgi:hypothetical protein